MSASNPQTRNQEYQIVLADIAMAMAIKTLDPEYSISCDVETYSPGAIREAWLGKTADKLLRMRVTPLATAGAASLQTLSAPELLSKAKNFGVPLTPEYAEEIVDYFDARRARVMTYDR